MSDVINNEHIFRYPNDRIVKQALIATWPKGNGRKRVGRPKTNWAQLVAKDLLENDLDLEWDKKQWREEITKLYEEGK